MADLKAFLLACTDRPFVWGEDDCSLFLADWWMANHGKDPAACLRGRYGTEEACHRLVLWSGGLLRLVSTIARGAGAQQTRTPEHGDLAVLKLGRRRVGGIRCGEFWAIRNEQVGFIRDAVVLRAWRI